MDSGTGCILCKTNATRSSSRGLVSEVNCPVCGQYETVHQDGKAAGYMLPPQGLHLISAHIRAHNKRTGRPYGIADRQPSGGFPEDLLDPSVSDKISKAVQLIAGKSRALGDIVDVDLTTEWPLVQAHGKSELTAILKHLVDERFVELSPGSLQGDTRIRLLLTAEGWKREESLRLYRGKSKQAFVAMAFASELDAAYDQGIRPALEACGYTPWRSDKENFTDKVCDRIIVEIRRSGLLVADVSRHRPGVYFEAGHGMGLGIPVLWTCCRNDMKDAHFDTRQYPHIIWDGAEDLSTQLRERVQALFPLPT